ncbi:MAG: TonB-dependent receptor [Gammaproteobacteria bacterium]|nr:TonB-dependent receptor [Gammaproteobacteria bacterium]
MFKKTPLASAIGAVTAGSLATLPAVAVAAAESEEEAIDEVVVVTGSRIRRDVSDAPSPITIIDREEIDLTGLENVADLLRTTTYNNFGSFRERSGSSFGQIALISLRGLGADRTAVLVNGRRVPGNPFTGTAAVDLNSIPLTAIDRVEILTDSASAVYGTDALGGVVNIILRDDYEGAEFEVGTDMPTREGADSDHFNFVFGASGERASMLFTAEWFKRDPIFDGERDYSKVKVEDPGDGTLPDLGVHTTGVSGGGNTAFAPGFSAASSVGDCPTEVYAGVVENPFGVPGTACGFGYADISAQTGGLDRISTYLTTNYEWQPGHSLFFDNRFTRIASFGRYAPAVGFFGVPGDSPYNPFDTSADSYPKLADGTPFPFSIFHRFVGHGPRDDDTERYEIDNVVGLEGELFEGTMNYEVYARNYRYQASEEGETYILQSQVELETELGDYNLTNPLSQDPAHLAALGRMAATLYRDILTDYTAAGVTLDGFGANLPAGQIGWAVGAEIASTEYLDDYDSFREAGNILGSAGNSASGNRSRWAGFGELSIPILDGLELTAAGRYDNYDDFGTAFSPQFAVRYQSVDMVVLRASWGQGFKAPNLTSLYQSRSQSFNNVTDTYRCAEMGTSPCPTFQVENFTGGNPELEAETAESFNFGVVVEPIPALSFSVDYFNIEIENVVTTLSLSQVLELENVGTLPSGVVVRRGARSGNARGRLVSIDNVYANLAVREITGIDLRLHYEADLLDGVVSVDVEATKLEEYELTPNPFDPPTDILDSNGSPDRRGALTLRWARDTLTLNYILRFIGPHGNYSSHHTSDLIGVYGFRWGGEIAGGVRNLMDEDPGIDEVNGWDDDALYLYDVAGRVPFISYRHSF